MLCSSPLLGTGLTNNCVGFRLRERVQGLAARLEAYTPSSKHPRGQGLLLAELHQQRESEVHGLGDPKSTGLARRTWHLRVQQLRAFSGSGI